MAVKPTPVPAAPRPARGSERSRRRFSPSPRPRHKSSRASRPPSSGRPPTPLTFPSTTELPASTTPARPPFARSLPPPTCSPPEAATEPSRGRSISSSSRRSKRPLRPRLRPPQRRHRQSMKERCLRERSTASRLPGMRMTWAGCEPHGQACRRSRQRGCKASSKTIQRPALPVIARRLPSTSRETPGLGMHRDNNHLLRRQTALLRPQHPLHLRQKGGAWIIADRRYGLPSCRARTGPIRSASPAGQLPCRRLCECPTCC